MGRRRKICFSGIGGQAVLEGIMMKNQDTWAVAVRKNDGKIAVTKQEDHSGKNSVWKKIPFVRGVFQFVDSLRLGMKSLNLSAEYFAEEEDEPTTADKVGEKLFGDGAENVLSVVTVCFSLVFAIALFMVLPYFLASLLAKVIADDSLLALFEGLIRLLIFLIYIIAITAVKDIRRVYQYHGAEHKCINCIEHGRILDVSNVRKSSRFHKRCGTSFLLFVMIISIILFFFIKVDQVWLRLVLRLLLIPVIAGISYEFIRFAGKSDNVISNLLSAPGLWLQRLTTKEPDDEMIEVAIAAVEAVFDWKDYLKKTFDYDVDAYLGLKEYDLDDLEEADGSDDMDVSEEIAAMEAEARMGEESEAVEAEAVAGEGSEAAETAETEIFVGEENEVPEELVETIDSNSDLMTDRGETDTETDFDSDMKEIRFTDEDPDEN